MATTRADDMPGQDVASIVENHTRTFIDDLNARAYDRIADTCHFHAKNYRMTASTSMGGGGLDLSGYLEAHRAMAREHPDFHIKIVDVRTELDRPGRGGQPAGGAHVFMMAEITGAPPGVVRHAMGIGKYLWIDGEWLCVHYEGLRGSLQDQMS